MSDAAREAARLVARIVGIEGQVRALSRASQIARSSLTVNGVDMPLPEAVGQGVQAAADVAILDAAMEELNAELTASREELAAARAQLEADLAEADEKLTAVQGTLATAEERIGDAETSIEDAFGRIDTAESTASAAATQASAAATQAVAAGTAAATAQGAADAARSAADAAALEASKKADVEYILARGTDLVTNGTGMLGDDRNFSGWDFDPVDTPTGTSGSFDKSGNTSTTTASDEFIPVDVNRRYLLRFQAKQKNPNMPATRFYAGVAYYDATKTAISPACYAYVANTMTTLAADLNTGDTTAQLTSAANWASAAGIANSYFAAWNYVDSFGKAWPAGTLTKSLSTSGIMTVSGNTVTLPSAWTRAKVPAGTLVSVNRSGGNYMYLAASNATMPLSWTTFAGSTLAGAHDGSTGTAASRQFPPGTAYAKILLLHTYTGSTIPSGQTSRQSIAGVSFSDATVALQEAELASSAAATAAAAASAAQTTADAAHTLAGQASTNATAAITAAGAAQSKADNIPLILQAITAPAGVAPKGSTWFRHAQVGSSTTDLSGSVIGQWVQTAEGSGSAWTESKIASEVIANLDVGKLTAGAAAIAQLVAQRIAAATASFQTVDVKNLFVTAGATMPEAVIAKLFADVVVAKTSVTSQAFIGESALIDGAVTARKLTVDQAFIDELFVNDLLVGALLGRTVTGATLQTASSGMRVVIDQATNSIIGYGIDGTTEVFNLNGDQSRISSLVLNAHRLNGTAPGRALADAAGIWFFGSDSQDVYGSGSASIRFGSQESGKSDGVEIVTGKTSPYTAGGFSAKAQTSLFNLTGPTTSGGSNGMLDLWVERAIGRAGLSVVDTQDWLKLYAGGKTVEVGTTYGGVRKGIVTDSAVIGDLITTTAINASRTKGTNQSVPNAAWTAVTWPNAVDLNGITYASNGTFTVPRAGRYLISVQVAFEQGGTVGQRVFRVNAGTRVIQSQQSTPQNTTYPMMPSVVTAVTLNAGETINVEAYQSQGAAVNVGVSASHTYISIDRVL